MIKNLSLLLFVGLASTANALNETNITCVPIEAHNSVLMAKALGDAEFMANREPAIIEQKTYMSVSRVNGVEVSKLDHSSQITQRGYVQSKINKKWKNNNQICVELSLID
jgi:maltodextrin utilization protein YvdJ